MIESVNVFPNKTSGFVDLEKEAWKIKEKDYKTAPKESEKNENIAGVTGITFKSVISLLFFVFFCAILAAALSDKVVNVVEKTALQRHTI